MRLLKLLLIVFVCAAVPAVADPIGDAWAPDRKKADDKAKAKTAYDNAIAYEHFNSILVVPAPNPMTEALVFYREAADLGHVEAQARHRPDNGPVPAVIRASHGLLLQLGQPGRPGSSHRRRARQRRGSSTVDVHMALPCQTRLRCRSRSVDLLRRRHRCA